MLTCSLQIQLKAEDLYDKEKVDLETIVVDDVFKLLQCDENGLTDEEATRRLELFGPNKLESEEQNPFLQVCIPLTSLALRCFAAICILSAPQLHDILPRVFRLHDLSFLRFRN